MSPGTLRTLLGKGHASFSGPGQQDAEEFLEHMLDLFESSASKQYVDPEEDMSRLFRFSMEERLQTSPTEDAPKGKVRYKKLAGKVLRLIIPEDKVDNAADVAAYAERKALSASEAEDVDMKTHGQKRKRGQDSEGENLLRMPFSCYEIC